MWSNKYGNFITTEHGAQWTKSALETTKRMPICWCWFGRFNQRWWIKCIALVDGLGWASPGAGIDLRNLRRLRNVIEFAALLWILVVYILERGMMIPFESCLMVWHHQCKWAKSLTTCAWTCPWRGTQDTGNKTPLKILQYLQKKAIAISTFMSHWQSLTNRWPQFVFAPSNGSCCHPKATTGTWGLSKRSSRGSSTLCWDSTVCQQWSIRTIPHTIWCWLATRTWS